MTIVFGSDEWCLNDVQISSCHRDWSISAEREKEGKKKSWLKKKKRQLRLL